jgi:hypothetical protein
MSSLFILEGISYSSYNYNLYPNSNSFTKNFVASEQEKQQQQRAFSSTSKSRSSRMPPISGDPIQDYVEKLLNENKIVVFSKTTCPWCVKVKQLFKELNEEFVSVELDKIGAFPQPPPSSLHNQIRKTFL